MIVQNIFFDRFFPFKILWRIHVFTQKKSHQNTLFCGAVNVSSRSTNNMWMYCIDCCCPLNQSPLRLKCHCFLPLTKTSTGSLLCSSSSFITEIVNCFSCAKAFALSNRINETVKCFYFSNWISIKFSASPNSYRKTSFASDFHDAFRHKRQGIRLTLFPFWHADWERAIMVNSFVLLSPTAMAASQW